MINNHLDVTISNALPLGAINPAYGAAIYRVPTTVTGNPNLKEERVDAFEISYTGTISNRVTVSAAYYYNKSTEQIFFTQTGTWGASPSPPGAPPPSPWE